MAFLRSPMTFSLGSGSSPPVPSPPPPPPVTPRYVSDAPTDVDIGVDIDCLADLSPTFELVTGTKALAQACARRLMTDRGSLFYDESYGFDLREQLNDAFGPGGLFALKNGAEREVENDERVSQAEAVVSYDDKTQAATVRLQVSSPAGPFALTLGVTALDVALLAGP